MARLASALEGPDSSIEAILAAEAARDHANTMAPVTVHRDLELQSERGSLADRIRALQAQNSPRISPDDPQRRN